MTTIWNVSYVNSLCKMRDFELERELNTTQLERDEQTDIAVGEKPMMQTLVKEE